MIACQTLYRFRSDRVRKRTVRRQASISLHFRLVVALVTMLFIAPVLAGNRALLIGTGNYRNPDFNLTGIDLDLEIMRHVARRLGFRDDEIRTLTDKQVTHEGIERAFGGFLSEAQGDDSVLVYYSGHGVQVPDLNGDEDDGRDEALTLHDLSQRRNGYGGVLLDDQLSQMLAALPSDNVMMIVDACHSGTVTRGITQSVALATRAYGDNSFQVKALPFIDDPAPGPSAPDTPARKDITGAGVVTLSAAQDHERALATRRGSTFTLALSESLETAGPDATFRQILAMSREIIEERVDRQYLFRPNLTGDEALFDRNMRVQAGATALSNRDSALAMTQAAMPAVASLNATRFGHDDIVELTFDAPADGYLNVIAVDADDALILLHPNRHAPDNRVSRGQVSLPGPREYEWVAQPPWGENLIVAVYTPQAVNLFDTSLQKRQDGESSQDYVLPFLDTLQRLGFGGRQAPPDGTRSVALPFTTCPEPAEGACP